MLNGTADDLLREAFSKVSGSEGGGGKGNVTVVKGEEGKGGEAVKEATGGMDGKANKKRLSPWEQVSEAKKVRAASKSPKKETK